MAVVLIVLAVWLFAMPLLVVAATLLLPALSRRRDAAMPLAVVIQHPAAQRCEDRSHTGAARSVRPA